MTNIYLGSRYSRLEEMRAYAAELRVSGYVVTSRWLSGEFGDLTAHTSRPEGSPVARAAGEHDREDMLTADIIVIFTDPPGYKSTNGRGGFHVEFGFALGMQACGRATRLLLVGHRLNSFHHFPEVEFHPNWNEARASLGAPRP